jgi:hypothetical protein
MELLLLKMPKHFRLVALFCLVSRRFMAQSGFAADDAAPLSRILSHRVAALQVDVILDMDWF